MPLEIECIPALRDNYIHFLYDPSRHVTAVVDPGEAEPVVRYLKSRSLDLNYILVTHHHADHTGGITELKNRTGCRVIASAVDRDRLEGVDRGVVDGDWVELGGARFQVLAIPGHTLGHVAYWCRDEAVLFCGDTLFNFGCGRIFEGTAPELFNSLEKLSALPDSTKIYCGHEYTQHNLSFALELEPHNRFLQQSLFNTQQLREKGRPTVPCTLGEQQRGNPFLRVRDPSIRAALKHESPDPVSVFTVLRLRKDSY